MVKLTTLYLFYPFFFSLSCLCLCRLGGKRDILLNYQSIIYFFSPCPSLNSSFPLSLPLSSFPPSFSPSVHPSINPPCPLRIQLYKKTMFTPPVRPSVRPPVRPAFFSPHPYLDTKNQNAKTREDQRQRRGRGTAGFVNLPTPLCTCFFYPKSEQH